MSEQTAWYTIDNIKHEHLDNADIEMIDVTCRLCKTHLVYVGGSKIPKVCPWCGCGGVSDGD